MNLSSAPVNNIPADVSPAEIHILCWMRMVALVTRAHFRYLGKLLVWQGVQTRWQKISGEMAKKVRADGKLAPIYAKIQKRSKEDSMEKRNTNGCDWCCNARFE